MKPIARLAVCTLYVFALYNWNSLCARLSADVAQAPAAKPPVAANSTLGAAARRAARLPGSSSRGLPRSMAAELPPTRPRTYTPPVNTPVKPAVAAAAPAGGAVGPRGREHQDGAAEGCASRRPFHTILTAQATVYQQWQSRIMYHHWKKQAAAGAPCSDMSGFTRLVASEGGKSDGLESEMPSVFVKQMTPQELAAHGHFGVLNRPYSVQQMIDSGALAAIREAYVYIAETDHVLMKPLPNLATETTPSAYGFGYMHASASVQPIIERFAPGVNWQSVQPIGPSPVIITKKQLELITPDWLQLSLALKKDSTADRRFGWVLEMWGWSIAAAKHGIAHDVNGAWQIEPGAGRDIPRAGGARRGADGYEEQPPQHYIFHYTYGIEYSLAGRVQTGQIGEWSLDKRHYGVSYPPRNLAAAPAGASESAMWLRAAWNEASAAIGSWPDTKALGTVGWRRNRGDRIAENSMADKVRGVQWDWAGVQGLLFQDGGWLKTPWGTGVWGGLPDQDYNDGGFCAAECLFADFSGALHNVKFDFSTTPATFKTWRVGDGEQIVGKAIGGV